MMGFFKNIPKENIDKIISIRHILAHGNFEQWVQADEPNTLIYNIEVAWKTIKEIIKNIAGQPILSECTSCKACCPVKKDRCKAPSDVCFNCETCNPKPTL